MRMPTDAELWQERRTPWSQEAHRRNVPVTTFRQRLWKRGWKKDKRGRLVKAPCAGCGESRKTRSLDADRMCTRCRQVPELAPGGPTEYEVELAYYLDRSYERQKRRRERMAAHGELDSWMVRMSDSERRRRRAANLRGQRAAERAKRRQGR